MKNFRMIEAILIGACLSAIAASGKAFVDVAVLKDNRTVVKEDIQEIKEDIKTIRNHLIPNRRTQHGR